MEQVALYLPLIVIFVYSVVLHEVAHGYAAYQYGDPTAYRLGRLTLNPIKHIDPFFTVLMPAALYIFSSIFSDVTIIFGAAKPVPVNPANFTKKVQGYIVVSSAGVIVNFLLVLFFAGIMHILLMMISIKSGNGTADISVANLIAMKVVFWGILINLLLGVFNLIPIPPLDGSHLFKYLLPRSLRYKYQKIGFLGIIILLILFYKGVFVAVFAYAYSAAFAITGLTYHLGQLGLSPAQLISQMFG